MTVTINLPGEAEQKLRATAERRGQTLEAYLEWLALNVAANSGPPHDQTADEWVAEWRAWVARHASNVHVADDSREGIYGDRGL